MEKDQDGVISQDAPEGTIARLSAGGSCSGCEFYVVADLVDCNNRAEDVQCVRSDRRDRKDVIFIRKP